MVVGLGNPGKTYQRTRHNLGWLVLEHAAHRWGIAFTQQGQALQGQGVIGGYRVLLALPLLWMNRTGEVIPSLLHCQNCTPSDLILVYDDLDLPLGALKIKSRGGAGGHNGLRSVLSYLETEHFCRLKVGIGRPPAYEDPATYVLTPFSSDEIEHIEALLPKAVDALECVIGEGCSVAMNQFHGLPIPREPKEP